WHDGTPVTGEDVRFTLAIDGDPSLGIPRNATLDLIADVATPDPWTVIVTWRQPFVEADALFSHAVSVPLPRHLLEGVFLADLTIGGALSLDQALQIQDRWTDGRLVNKSGASVPAYPQFVNSSPPLLTDLRFRRALLEAIDRQQVVDTLMAGQSMIAHTFISP